MHKPTILATRNTKEMAEFPPVEIGTRGTVGSLLMQEIEYYSRQEFNSQDWSQKNKSQTINMGSSVSTNSRPTTVSRVESTKKKQSSKLLPKMCSVVDVSDNSKPKGTSAFSYKNLKSDIKHHP